MSLLALILVAWVLWKLPDYPGEAADKRRPLYKVFVIPGVRPVLFVVLAWMLAHNILYTYIAPYLAQAKLTQRVDLVLLIFGIASLVGIWVIGVLIDQKLRPLVLISLAAFTLASVALGISSSQPVVIYLVVAVWGLTFGGAATLLQTAVAESAGESADVAQSMLVTAWNLGIGGGGVIGGILIETLGVGSFPWALFILLLLALLVAWRAKEYGFPLKKH
jgi:predicted MFS family arabinose efflux permease